MSIPFDPDPPARRDPPTGGSEVVARAPAKVNLALSVGGPRADGFHELATVFHAVSLYDDVSAEPAAELSVRVRGRYAAGVPVDEGNLALRAARLLAEHTGVEAGASLTITKGIPVAAGLAGGSADAAAALVACDALWGTGLSREELRELAADLGSDVPFSLLGGTAIGTGRGEQLTPVLTRGALHWVLAVAGTGLATPKVYRELDRLRSARVLPEPQVPQRLLQAVCAGEAEAVGPQLDNDLQPAACSLMPVLQETLHTGQRLGALGALVSGSGPTVAFLVGGPQQARLLAEALSAAASEAGAGEREAEGEADGDGAIRCIERAHGPVPGARLVEAVRG